MQDADLDLAVKSIRASRIISSGQVCNCAEGVYVQESIADRFIAKMTKAMEKTVVGDPFLKDTEMGPMVSKAQMESVDLAVQTAVQDGAELLFGGKKYAGRKGYFYSPTVLTDCWQDTQIMQQEVFGPALPITTFKDLDEARLTLNLL